MPSHPAAAILQDACPTSHRGLCGRQRAVSTALALLVAIIYLQTLFFKFTGAAESVAIFTKLGAEPWGRIGSGVAELIAAVLVLIPRTRVVGAAMALGIIAGAIGSHLTVLGIEVEGDGGLLFGLAVAVAAGSAGLLYLHRFEVQEWLRWGLGLLRRGPG